MNYSIEEKAALTFQIPLVLENPSDLALFFESLKDVEEATAAIFARAKCINLLKRNISKKSIADINCLDLEVYNRLLIKNGEQPIHPEMFYEIDKLLMASPLKIVLKGFGTFIVTLAALSTLLANYDESRSNLLNHNSQLRRDIEKVLESSHSNYKKIEDSTLREIEEVMYGMEIFLKKKRNKIHKYRRGFKIDESKKEYYLCPGDILEKCLVGKYEKVLDEELNKSNFLSNIKKDLD